MKNLKKDPTKQLEKFSTVFMQLGLVLVLFVVYTLLEYESEQVQYAINDPGEVELVYISEDIQNVIFQKEVKVTPKIKLVTPKLIDLIDLTKGEDTVEETPFPDELIDDEPTVLDIDNVEFIVPTEAPEPDTVPYMLIEDAPIFKGCEGLSKEANKKCFEKSIARFFIKNFDEDLAQELGLRSGKHKIHSQFIIDKSGDVAVVFVKAPHKQLEKEAKRIMNKLPQFTPGKQRRKPVKVKYTLPITFHVQ
jgi:protein TonB